MSSVVATPELQHRIEQFLYHEARLLDARHYREWYALLTDDLIYRMPLRRNRLSRESAAEFTSANEACYFDETKDSIDRRLRRLESGFAWAEEPASRTRHMVTNVWIRNREQNAVSVTSYFYLYRSRLERQIDEFVGARNDVLRPTATQAGFQIAAREILLDQATVNANNLSMFF